MKSELFCKDWHPWTGEEKPSTAIFKLSTIFHRQSMQLVVFHEEVRKSLHDTASHDMGENLNMTSNF